MTAPTRDPTPAPCTHKRATHLHGTHACYVLDRCGCGPCRAANTAYERRRIRQRAYGRVAFADAEPVRRHIRALMAEGMGWKTIAARSGVPRSVVGRLLYGEPCGGEAPSAGILPANAEKLLATVFEPAPHALVDAAPSWRLIHGLIALGYTKRWIARQLGRGNSLQLADGHILHKHAAAIRELVERYGATRGPSQRARAHAATQGWTTDLLWDDYSEEDDAGELVDPVAVERACLGDSVRLTRAEKIVAVTRLRDAGVTQLETARLLAMDARQVCRYLQVAS